MTHAQEICHRGRIASIEGQLIRVNIISTSACSACHAQGACNLSDREEKTIEVRVEDSRGYSLGQEVVISMAQGLGLQAMLWAYFFPFLLMLLVFIVLWELTGSEAGSGLSALGVLIPYYGMLYLLRGRMNMQMKFSLRPADLGEDGLGQNLPYVRMDS